MANIVVGNGITGNVSDCKTITAVTKIEREKALSLTEKKTYSVINQCTLQEMSSYTVPEVTLAGWVMFPLYTVGTILVLGTLVANVFELLIELVKKSKNLNGTSPS